ncbi:MAG: 4-(cytidine 5'-diphospho)-2-C-methyl-D-erythritol kinase, partial [Oscillospiraceae bacterium]|nr:4-(cytidine 5'-diphospho)-2-C-methyl-D-erythritol kinase [Oscillospiraceae bacterium]
GKKLHELAARVGADVPFCLCGGTKICRGIGDIISEAPPLKECAFLIVMPDFACSTTEAYRRYDENPLPARKNFKEFIESGGEYWRHLYNVFEELYGDRRITELTDKLRCAGALGAALTGSGAAVYGLFADANGAAAAAREFPTLFTAVCTAV